MLPGVVGGIKPPPKQADLVRAGRVLACWAEVGVDHFSGSSVSGGL
jgi:hypothetical protein